MRSLRPGRRRKYGHASGSADIRRGYAAASAAVPTEEAAGGQAGHEAGKAYAAASATVPTEEEVPLRERRAENSRQTTIIRFRTLTAPAVTNAAS